MDIGNRVWVIRNPSIESGLLFRYSKPWLGILEEVDLNGIYKVRHYIDNKLGEGRGELIHCNKQDVYVEELEAWRCYRYRLDSFIVIIHKQMEYSDRMIVDLAGKIKF